MNARAIGSFVYLLVEVLWGPYVLVLEVWGEGRTWLDPSFFFNFLFFIFFVHFGFFSTQKNLIMYMKKCI